MTDGDHKGEAAGASTIPTTVAGTIEQATAFTRASEASQRLLELCQSPDQAVELMNREWAVVLTGSRTMVMREPDGSSAETPRKISFLTIDAFRNFFRNRIVAWTETVRDVSGDGQTTRIARVNAANLWLRHSQRRTYDGVCFFPNPDGAAPPKGYFNLWRGYSARPDTGPGRDRWLKYKTFRDHLLTNVCQGDPELFEWLFAWMAHLVQRPRERSGTALVLRGRKGTGKTITGEVLGSLIACHYLLVDDERYLTGQFNNHMADCLLLQVDEGVWAGSKQNEGRLKGLITSRQQMIEQKGVDPVLLDNYVRVIFTSNEDWVVPAGFEERRFAVFDVGEAAMQKHHYFSELQAELDAGGRGALLADLIAYDLDAPDGPDLRRIPRTRALLDQKIRSLEPIPAWWFGRLEAGAPLHNMDSWPIQPIAISALYNDFVTSSEKTGIRRKANTSVFGMTINKIIPGVKRSRRRMQFDTGDNGHSGAGSGRVWCYELPSLEQCRHAFEGLLQQPVEWPTSDENEDIDRPRNEEFES